MCTRLYYFYYYYFIVIISKNIRHISLKFGISVFKRRYTNFYFSLYQSNVAPTSYDI
jgi:hypothetical protein